MQDHAEVTIKPPVLYAGALVLGCLMTLILPLGPGLGAANWRGLAVGATFAVLGAALVGRSVFVFRRAGTTETIGEPTTTIVETGPYRFTRNPIYIGLTLLYFGLAVMLTSGWMLLLLIPVLMVMQRGVVEREEAYLTQKFGDVYRRYQARVPRWL
jgi:protein-S-isoprenylcysteine O-methyltransferase Ste14